jgi:hypothetical protein
MASRISGVCGKGVRCSVSCMVLTALTYWGSDELETLRFPSSRSAASHPINPNSFASVTGSTGILSLSQYEIHVVHWLVRVAVVRSDQA